MNRRKRTYQILLVLIGVLCFSGTALALVHVQCPGDTDGDAQWASAGEVQPANTACLHLSAGDGFATMADGTSLYTFGFSDMTGIPVGQVMNTGMLNAKFPAPTIRVQEGTNVYLTLSNVGMVMRPDLFDPHSVHFHGYPNASTIFDGEPMASISINMGSSLTYYYVAPDPGTYMYHCHVEATEHMQMGMLGNLFVTPLQDGQGLFPGCAADQYVFNDGDGSTCYDLDFPVQIHAFDRNFHELHINVQPLPFALMKDDYPMLNGRGYPDTIDAASLAPPLDPNGNPLPESSQAVSSLITANQGERILLRVSSLSTVDYYTLRVLGIPMQVVGSDARQLKGGPGNLYYTTNSVTLGGGQSADVILDTSTVQPGTYFLYTTNLNHLSNGPEDFGGMMTEIVIQ